MTATPLVSRGELCSGAASAPRVLFIGGYGRSGSTLLERVLGQTPGICAVGELVHLWRRGLLEGQLCGCGVRFHDCEFWSRVGEKAFGGWGQVDGEAAVRLQGAVDRARFLPALVAPRLAPQHQRDLRRYADDLLGPLLDAIAAVSGTGVIVDSSKHVSTAFVLRAMSSIDLRVIHLVRHSHGVAHSWTKEVRRPELSSGEGLMPRYHPINAGLQWTVWNSLFHGLGRLGVPRLFVRYETFVRSPRREALRILDFAGVDVDRQCMPFLNEGHVVLGPTHSVAGNPMRFRHGEVALALDEAWRDQMRTRHRRLVSLATWPLLTCYGYMPNTGEERRERH